ncbi:MAG: hydroxyacid dehydrogenase [Clostridia bacterium]|nr:hydroxyacid dehydrogenase [Clostridia bacterium]
MKITMLDASTLGSDLDFDMITRLGEVKIYDKTPSELTAERIGESDVIILNKVKVNESNLRGAEKLKLICVTATGYDNVDIDYCRRRGIAVCNVVGYSSASVAQLTVAMALSLVCHLSEYDRYSKSGAYTKSGIHNMLEPVYYELAGKTWGIIGMGNIGKSVASVAESLGCRVIYTRNSPDSSAVSLDTVLRESHIISIHTPLTDKTLKMIGDAELSKCEKKPVLINVARGAVCDEAALAAAVLDGRLSGLGVDVYSCEPFPEDHPYAGLSECDNVILTPHMAWGAYEARVRCMNEVAENIKAFCSGGDRGRIV